LQGEGGSYAGIPNYKVYYYIIKTKTGQ
jgi:hypothetical protein